MQRIDSVEGLHQLAKGQGELDHSGGGPAGLVRPAGRRFLVHQGAAAWTTHAIKGCDVPGGGVNMVRGRLRTTNHDARLSREMQSSLRSAASERLAVIVPRLQPRDNQG